jgi:predicted tellurium resistance membrane protein TerC
MDWTWVNQPDAWAALGALLALEIVLGIDNIVFISILAGKLPPEQRPKARYIGLGLALVMRIVLLFSISWIMTLKTELFKIGNLGFSGKELILLAGGLFLIYKAVKEIHHKLEGAEDGGASAGKASLNAVIGQIVVIDLVFSIDSVITAVGMTKYVSIMVIAVIVSVSFMLAFAAKLSAFVEAHPTVKMLALAFLVLIGVNLISEGFGYKIEKGFTYFAMAFSVGVEMLNLSLAKKKKAHAVKLLNVPKMPDA